MAARQGRPPATNCYTCADAHAFHWHGSLPARSRSRQTPRAPADGALSWFPAEPGAAWTARARTRTRAATQPGRGQPKHPAPPSRRRTRAAAARCTALSKADAECSATSRHGPNRSTSRADNVELRGSYRRRIKCEACAVCNCPVTSEARNDLERLVICFGILLSPIQQLIGQYPYKLQRAT